MLIGVYRSTYEICGIHKIWNVDIMTFTTLAYVMMPTVAVKQLIPKITSEVALFVILVLGGSMELTLNIILVLFSNLLPL